MLSLDKGSGRGWWRGRPSCNSSGLFGEDRACVFMMMVKSGCNVVTSQTFMYVFGFI